MGPRTTCTIAWPLGMSGTRGISAVESPPPTSAVSSGEPHDEQKRAVDSGYWPLYRYNPANTEKPFAWETKPATASYQEFIRSESRYTQLLKTAPAEAEELFKRAEEDAKRRMSFFEKLGQIM